MTLDHNVMIAWPFSSWVVILMWFTRYAISPEEPFVCLPTVDKIAHVTEINWKFPGFKYLGLTCWFLQWTLVYRHGYIHRNLHSCFYDQLALLRHGQWKRWIQRELLDRTSQTSCHRAESKIVRTATNLVSKRAKFNIDFENIWFFRKAIVRDRKLRF